MESLSGNHPADLTVGGVIFCVDRRAARALRPADSCVKLIGPGSGRIPKRWGAVNDKAVKPIAVTAEQAAELEVAVWCETGEAPDIHGFHGRRTPDSLLSLSCKGRPEVVAFELCVLLAGDVAAKVCRAGYRYGASDFVEEVRRLVLRLGVAQTEAIGRELVFYWPTVVLVD